MDGFAFAGEALSGKCAGAGDYQALKKVIRNLFLWGSGVALTFTLFYMAGGKALMNLLTDEGSVIATASDYLPWAVFIPLAGLSAFIWDGVFIGLTATRYMLLSMLGATPDFFSASISASSLYGKTTHSGWLFSSIYSCEASCNTCYIEIKS